MKDLKQHYGTTALVTGASSGIGEAFAWELAARGLDLVLVARRVEILEAIKEELARRHGTKVWVIEQDLADPAAGEKIQSQLQAASLNVDILVNNAGFGVYEEFGSRAMDKDLMMIDVHCRAVADLTWRLLPAMKARRRGAVIIISSVLGVMPSPYLATYAATKAFDLSLGESLYGEMKRYGVDVLAVMPTLTETGFHAGANVKKMPIFTRQSADVVRTALWALGRKPSVADGPLTKVLMLLMKFTPRKWLVAGYLAFRKQPEDVR